MTQRQPSHARLTHNVVQQAAELMIVSAIVATVDVVRPITMKNPKSMIPGAISGSRVIVSTGDGRYGWKPRLINGSVIRHTLSEAGLAEKTLHWDIDLQDALWPTRDAQKQDAELNMS